MTQPLPPEAVKPDNVVISWCQPGTVNAAFAQSVLDLLVFDMSYKQRIVNGGGRIAKYATVNVSSSRNAIVREFLDEHTAAWLFMVDVDMAFKPDLVERLLAGADPQTAPIVGGLCFGATDGVLWPTMYELGGTAEAPCFFRWGNFPLDALVKVTATGGACLLMHRDALVTIGEKFDGAFPWFQETSMGGEPLGEDLTFCLRAGVCGIPIHVNTGARLDHYKATVLNLERFAAQLRAKDEAEATARVATDA